MLAHYFVTTDVNTLAVMEATADLYKPWCSEASCLPLMQAAHYAVVYPAALFFTAFEITFPLHHWRDHSCLNITHPAISAWQHIFFLDPPHLYQGI